MDKRTQAELLAAILDNMKAHLMSRVEHFPDSWDGHEIRQYCSDMFARELRPMERVRMRAYRNDVMTRPL